MRVLLGIAMVGIMHRVTLVCWLNLESLVRDLPRAYLANLKLVHERYSPECRNYRRLRLKNDPRGTAATICISAERRGNHTGNGWHRQFWGKLVFRRRTSWKLNSLAESS